MRWVKLSLVSESSVNSHGGNLMTQNFGKTIQSPFHLWSLLSSAFVASSMSIKGLWWVSHTNVYFFKKDRAKFGLIWIFQFTVDPGPFSFNLSISHTILIGNVPFRSSFPDFQGNECQLNATAAISESATMLEHNDNPFPADSSSVITVTDYYPDLRN